MSIESFGPFAGSISTGGDAPAAAGTDDRGPVAVPGRTWTVEAEGRRERSSRNREIRVERREGFGDASPISQDGVNDSSTTVDVEAAVVRGPESTENPVDEVNADDRADDGPGRVATRTVERVDERHDRHRP